MTSKLKLRVRRSLTDLQDNYANGVKKPLEDLMRAWKGIKELPPNDAKSFFMLGGFHGEPFRGAGYGNSAFWGGYCNHGNVLFPTWHRVYLLKLEEALQSVPGCEDVMLPFWDETSAESVQNGIPWALTDENFTLDGKLIANPLRSFVFTKAIVDTLSPFPDADYSKPLGYETVRYPLSGLVGPNDLATTQAHNALYPYPKVNVALLNQNVVNWLTNKAEVNGTPLGSAVKDDYVSCLNAPNYTVFSNYTSSGQWFLDTGRNYVSLEQPHDSIHLAVGGFDLPSGPDLSPIQGANGDMGENDTAGLDPIFFFHHCFVDRVFWLWQKKHKATDKLEIIADYPGTNSIDDQGPTPGVAPNTWLTMESPLNPFRTKDGAKVRPYTSLDCVNIETQLGYTYGSGSLEEKTLELDPAISGAGAHVVDIRGLNRGGIRGSFVISAFANIDGRRQRVGTRAVLSRWHVDGCANCQTHLETRAAIPIRSIPAHTLEEKDIEVEVRTRTGPLRSREGQGKTAASEVVGVKPAFTFSLR